MLGLWFWKDSWFQVWLAMWFQVCVSIWVSKFAVELWIADFSLTTLFASGCGVLSICLAMVEVFQNCFDSDFWKEVGEARIQTRQREGNARTTYSNVCKQSRMIQKRKNVRPQKESRAVTNNDLDKQMNRNDYTV